MLTHFTVADTAACVQGHFPGMPIVPGAFLLATAHTHLIRHYPGWVLAAFKKVKFSTPLLPNQRAELSIDDSAWPRVKVQINCAGQCVLAASGKMERS